MDTNLDIFMSSMYNKCITDFSIFELFMAIDSGLPV